MESQGVGPDWARPQYGEYYAKSPFLYSAVKLRADAVVRPPLVVYQDVADGKKPAGPNHPLQELLNRANNFLTYGDVMRATSTYLDIWGSAFWVLTKEGQGSKPKEIWPVRPDRMRIIPSPTEYISRFEYQRQHQWVPLRIDEVVWFRLHNPMNEYAGLSPIAAIRLSLDTGIDASQHNRNQFKNDLLISNVWIKTDSQPSPEELEDFDKRLKRKFASPSRSRLPFIGTKGMEPHVLGFSPRDMEHLKTLRFTLEDVSRAYGIPKIMLGDLERSTFSNFEQAEIIFWRNMASYLQFMQNEINEMLVPQFGTGLSVEFDLSEIEALQDDVNEVHARLRNNVKATIMTPNEAREEMGLKPVPDGDVLLQPINVVPLGGEIPKAPTTEDFSPDGHSFESLSTF